MVAGIDLQLNIMWFEGGVVEGLELGWCKLLGNVVEVVGLPALLGYLQLGQHLSRRRVRYVELALIASIDSPVLLIPAPIIVVAVIGSVVILTKPIPITIFVILATIAVEHPIVVVVVVIVLLIIVIIIVVAKVVVGKVITIVVVV
jgi:hypothetical protein